MKTYDIIVEPKDETYKKLIMSSLKYCDSFLLIIIPTKVVKDTVKEIINELQPYLVKKSAESEWPGTKLYKGSALVYQFELNEKTAKYLTNITFDLYSWTQPNFPEDLCLLRKSGEPWLTTISQDNDSYLVLSEDEKSTIMKEIPELVLREAIKIVN